VEYWPSSDDEGFGTFINQIPKYVVSNSLTAATWNNTTLVRGDEAAERLRRVKAETEGETGMSAAPRLSAGCSPTGCSTSSRLLLHPIAVGHGQRLFEDTPTHPLRLVSSRTLGGGVLSLAYAPDSDAPTA
jgi:hypothetical protein